MKRLALFLSRTGKWIAHPQTGKPGKIPVGSPQFMRAVIQTNCGDARVVDHAALHFGLCCQPRQCGPVLRCFTDEHQRRRLGLNVNLGKRLLQRGRGIKDFCARHNRDELVYAGPGDRPRGAACGQFIDAGMRRRIPLVVGAMGVDQKIGIDGNHRWFAASRTARHPALRASRVRPRPLTRPSRG